MKIISIVSFENRESLSAMRSSKQANKLQHLKNEINLLEKDIEDIKDEIKELRSTLSRSIRQEIHNIMISSCLHKRTTQAIFCHVCYDRNRFDMAKITNPQWFNNGILKL